MKKCAVFRFIGVGTIVLVLNAALLLSAFGGGQQASQEKAQTKEKAQQPPKTLKSEPSLALRRNINSTDFEKVVSSALSGAYYMVNSCGGTDSARNSKIFVSGVYQKVEPLGRLDIALPSYVLEQTMRQEISYSDNPPVIRNSALRACVDNIRTYNWKGAVEGGRLKISMQFNSNLFIKTRIMEEEKKSGGWKEHFDWKDPLADKNIPDYFYVAPSLDVFLSPVLQNGAVSYSQVEVKWSWVEDKGFVWPENALVRDPFVPPYGHSFEKEQILNYKTQVMSSLAGRITNAFSDPSVRKHLTAALTSSVKTGDVANREIVGVDGMRSAVSIQFK